MDTLPDSIKALLKELQESEHKHCGCRECDTYKYKDCEACKDDE
jgi:recombinational DNA repair protein RecR